VKYSSLVVRVTVSVHGLGPFYGPTALQLFRAWLPSVLHQSAQNENEKPTRDSKHHEDSEPHNNSRPCYEWLVAEVTLEPRRIEDVKADRQSAEPNGRDAPVEARRIGLDRNTQKHECEECHEEIATSLRTQPQEHILASSILIFWV